MDRQMENQVLGMGDFEALSAIATDLRGEQAGPEVSPWTGSPFEWFLQLPPATKGRIGKELIKRMLIARGMTTSRPHGSEADLMVNGRRVELKLSTLWKTRVYKFQQLRDQDYEYVICLGLSPFSAHWWVFPKQVGLANTLGQHGGPQGSVKWLVLNPSSPPAWLENYGNSFRRAIQIIRSMDPIS